MPTKISNTVIYSCWAPIPLCLRFFFHPRFASLWMSQLWILWLRFMCYLRYLYLCCGLVFWIFWGVLLLLTHTISCPKTNDIKHFRFLNHPQAPCLTFKIHHPAGGLWACLGEKIPLGGGSPCGWSFFCTTPQWREWIERLVKRWPRWFLKPCWKWWSPKKMHRHCSIHCSIP